MDSDPFPIKATANYGVHNLDFKVLSGYQKDKTRLAFTFSYSENNLEKLVLYLNQIPNKIGNNNIISADSADNEALMTVNDHDLILDFYLPIQIETNIFSIDTIDAANNYVSGRFDLSFVRDTRFQKRGYFPDTISLKNGMYSTILDN